MIFVINYYHIIYNNIWIHIYIHFRMSLDAMFFLIKEVTLHQIFSGPT